MQLLRAPSTDCAIDGPPQERKRARRSGVGTRQDSLFYAEDYVDVLIAANPGFKFVKTGWRGSRPQAAADRRSRNGAG